MKFYTLDTSKLFSSSPFAYGEEDDPHLTGESPLCPLCSAPIGALEWLSPRSAIVSKGDVGDVILGTFSTFLCSENFKEKYLVNHLKGISDFQKIDSIKQSQKRGFSLSMQDPFYNVQINVGSAMIDETKSVIKRSYEKDPCKICKSGTIHSYNGLYIDIATWNHDDIFYAYGLPGVIFVSQRFFQFVANEKISNINLIPSEASQWDEFGRI